MGFYFVCASLDFFTKLLILLKSPSNFFTMLKISLEGEIQRQLTCLVLIIL